MKAALKRKGELRHGRCIVTADRRSILFIGLPWLIFHYITKWKTGGDAHRRATRSCSTSSTTWRAGSTTGSARSSGS